ncbi:MAG: FliH/SctL family protein [Armatimonadota bacterium]
MNKVIKSSGLDGVSVSIHNAVELERNDISKNNNSQTDINIISEADRMLEVAKQVLENANLEAEKHIQTAKKEADAIRESARSQGYNEGYKQGISEGSDKIVDLYRTLEGNLNAFNEDRAVYFEKLEPEVLKLTIEIVEKIIRHEIKTNQEIVIRLIKSCLRRLKDKQDIFVRVSPKEVDEVRLRIEELLSVTAGAKEISILDDRRVNPGGCIIESPSGELDARIETQISRVEDAIMETHEHDRRDANCKLGEVSESSKETGHNPE